MKKLALLLFMAGLIVIGFTNTNCTRRSGDDITPIIGGDTQKTTTTVDTNGEHIYGTIYQNQVSQSEPGAGGAVVYLLVTADAYGSYIMDTSVSHLKKLAAQSVTAGSDGTYKFPNKIKPASVPLTQYYKHGPYAGSPVHYYLVAIWNNNGTTERGSYVAAPKGNNVAGDEVSVSINDGKGTGVPAPIAVTPK